MGDTVIITEDEAKPAKPADVICSDSRTSKTEKVVKEKTTITETKID
jgi:hypothetical protein